ncbi:hypothetical protein GOODEAATRI_012400 [Goodea atripinnis]|uniref:Uncharacterized protein n=1 Tax=Goodea atripinnis TaxID=208336 RepID=A0ABV0NTY9_9TELE
MPAALRALRCVMFFQRGVTARYCPQQSVSSEAEAGWKNPSKSWRRGASSCAFVHVFLFLLLGARTEGVTAFLWKNLPTDICPLPFILSDRINVKRFAEEQMAELQQREAQTEEVCELVRSVPTSSDTQSGADELVQVFERDLQQNTVCTPRINPMQAKHTTIYAEFKQVASLAGDSNMTAVEEFLISFQKYRTGLMRIAVNIGT